MYPYPEGVGKPIEQFTSKSSIEISNLDLKNTIITIFGLPSTGKGTLSRAVAKRLNLPVFDTGVMYRVFTYFLVKNSHSYNLDCLDLFIKDFNLDLVDNQIVVYLEGLKLENKDIRNPSIDSVMGNYTKLPEVRKMIDGLIAGFVLRSSFVTDGRGAYDGYLLEAEKLKVKVIRVLLQAEQAERIRRRFIDYLELERGTEITAEKVQNLWKTCEEIVKLRDEEEIIKEKNLNLGMVSPDSGVLDTTSLTIDQAVEAVLGWLNLELKN